MKATEVTAGLAESNVSLLPGLRRDSLHVTCGLTASTPGEAPDPTLGNEYGKTLPFLCRFIAKFHYTGPTRARHGPDTDTDTDTDFFAAKLRWVRVGPVSVSV